MRVLFKNRKMKKLCEDFNKLKIKHGDQVAREIMTRIGELVSSENLSDIFKIPQARCHPLTGNLKAFYSVDAGHPKRLLLRPLNGIFNDTKTISEIEIYEIRNQHE